ncbi:Inhibitor of apoptosis-promoting Bax1-related protein [Coemansia sp. RSA 1933]|nr:Inhibitor of apoptosis-promoting Bax1-related protein [Coemansia sp. RSA 1933]
MLDSNTILSAFSETAHLAPHTQQQLVQVYTTLALAVVSSMVGYRVAGQVGGGSELLVLAGIVAGTVMVYVVRPTKANMQWRRMALWMVTGLVGTTVRPIVDGMQSTPAVVLALVLALTLFGSFALVTMMTPRARTIYLMGSATAGLASLAWCSVFTYFYPAASVLLRNLSVLVSLGFACLSVVAHTHGILDLARAGVDLDPVVHALTLFDGLVSLFIHLMALLSSNNSNSTNRTSRNRRTRHRSTAVPVDKDEL